MIRIKGFDVGDELYRGVRSLVFRGARKSDNLPVVIKTHAAEFPTHAEIRRYEHEFEIGRSIRDDHVIRYLDLTPCNNGKAIIEETLGRINLKQYFQTSGLGLEQFLSIAIQLTRGLDAIHKAHVIHKDIKPSNIIIDSDSSRIKIIDFSISSRARKEIPDAVNPEKVGGTLPYISPEQTGRINRAVDFRSDFYSLGVTLYEMLTGRLPFEFVDPMEQIHAHIARLPEPPLALAPGTPRMLSRIVMKLLSKAAEDRYQGGRGLRADLERCARDLETSGGISPFTPGKEDFSETFQIPRKLYGRCREKKTLLDVFEKVRQGERRMLLAFGPAGMGKSALVKETMRPAVLKHGYFVSGGFEELKRGTPYFGLIRAFQGLIDEILSQSNEKMAAWKTRILSALGPNARIIMDVVPGLEDILGPRPPAPELNPAEAQNRFEQMFRNFIRALCRPGRPLVLFLNDLQYADPASLDLIAHAMTDARVNTFLLIGACREDGASPGRGLSALLERLEKSGESPVRMSLTRLSLAHVTRMVAETLQSDENVAAPLARLVHEKTDGNPYFAELFLKNLHAEGVIRFENPADAAPGWRWDPAEIENRDVTDNVVDLLIRKLEGLPDPTRKALQLAACMGNRFHMEELEKIFGKGETELADDLGPALDEGLVVGARAPGASRGRPRTRAFEFAHGDVRRAAHALMEETEKNRAHLKIGEAMLSNVREDDPGEKIFDIASHLNQGGEYILYDPEIKKLVELNLLAGKRAKASNAHASSLNYLRAGIDWMEG
ncbi:MAG: serine/threonine-protein kinase PknK, partial [Desulfobacterales bacterium]|nr:serine/threonine-protein kinase PknK [Desulfobacterales bacterium]